MHRVPLISAALASAFLIASSSVPSAAADCYWSNGAYRCTDRSGRTYVVRRPRAEPQYRREYVQPRSYGSQFGGGNIGSFTYSCTLSRCD